ncbi:MAG: BatD family protein [Bacteroidota bacterium]|nr:BatD family protein [Bacteroidota bacterium]
MPYVFSFLFTCLHLISFAQVSFFAETDARSILVGQTFTVSFRLNNAEGVGFTPPDFKNLQYVSGPSRSSYTSIINGRTTTSMGYVYTLLATKAGSYTIRAAFIKVSGKSLSTKPITIQILAASQNNTTSKDIIIRAMLDTNFAYPAQQISLSYKLYTRVSVNRIEVVVSPNLDDFQKEYINVSMLPSQQEVFNGHQYTTKVIARTVLYPLKKGPLTLTASTYKVYTGEDDPFGFGMNSLFSSNVETITTNELKLNILPLPSPIPPTFSGAVGNFTAKVEGINERYTIHDAIMLGLKIEGDGNFNFIKPALFQLDTFFESSDSKSYDITKLSEEPKIISSRYFEYYLTPTVTGKKTLKTIFTFFDPSQNKYIDKIDSFELEIISSPLSVNQKKTKAIELDPIRENVHIKYQTNGDNSQRYYILFSLFPIAIFVFSIVKNRISNNRYIPFLPIKKNTRYDLAKNNLTNLNYEIKLEDLETLLIENILRILRINIQNPTLFYLKQFVKKQQDIHNKDHILSCIEKLERLKYGITLHSEEMQNLKKEIMEI